MAGPEISGDKAEKIIGDKTLHVVGMWSPRFRGRTTGRRPGCPGGGGDVVAPISGADDRTTAGMPWRRWGCGRPDFGGGRQGGGARARRDVGMWSPRFRGRTTGAATSGWRDTWMWSPRFRGRTTGCGHRTVRGMRDVVAPISGADDRGNRLRLIRILGCGRPDFGGRTTGSRWTRPSPGRDVVAPISGADGRSKIVTVWAVPGCGRPDFRGRMAGDFARTGKHVPMQPFRESGADNERNGRADRGRSSLEAGGSNGPGHRIGTRNGIDDRRRTSAR